MKKENIVKWIPALLMMGIIFWFSAQPGDALPVFSWGDKIIKKMGHMIGYGLLAFWVWYGLGLDVEKRWLAWLFAMLYAVTDEIHQSFVPYRNASVWDVLIFDNLGALLSLWIMSKFVKQKRPDENI